MPPVREGDAPRIPPGRQNTGIQPEAVPRLHRFNQKQYRVSIAPRKEGDVEIVWNLAADADFHGFICTDCGLVVFDYEHPMDRWL